MDRCQLLHATFDDAIGNSAPDSDPYPPEVEEAIKAAGDAMYAAYNALSKWEDKAPTPIAIPLALAEAFGEDQMGMHKSPAVEAVFLALRSGLGV